MNPSTSSGKRCILPGVIGRACTHPCEEACVRKDMDGTLAIRLLKRAAADQDLATGASALTKPTAEKTEKIAIVGAGPAGLAAAYHLRRMGYQVTIFEAFPKGGGMAAVGIPDYRLPKNILEHEIELISGWALTSSSTKRSETRHGRAHGPGIQGHLPERRCPCGHQDRLQGRRCRL